MTEHRADASSRPHQAAILRSNDRAPSGCKPRTATDCDTAIGRPSTERMHAQETTRLRYCDRMTEHRAVQEQDVWVSGPTSTVLHFEPNWQRDRMMTRNASPATQPSYTLAGNLRARCARPPESPTTTVDHNSPLPKAHLPYAGSNDQQRGWRITGGADSGDGEATVT